MSGRLTNLITNSLGTGGLLGLFVLIALGSTIIPIPQELVLLLTGFILVTNKTSFIFFTFFTATASLAGALVSYSIGYYGRERFIKRYGKYFFLSHEHVKATDRFFKKYGEKTIFISRFIPFLKHIISIPAGISKMRLDRFIVHTFLSSLFFNAITIYLGFKLKENWSVVNEYLSGFGVILAFTLLSVLAYFAIKLYLMEKHGKN